MDTTQPRVIILGNGAVYSLGAYARAWRTCKAAAPGTEFSHGLTGWWSETREAILRQFMYGLHDRINLRGNVSFVGRKHDSDYERNLRRDQAALRERLALRLAVHQFLTPDVQSRFSHLLSSYEE